ncbi:MAG: 50S ribosomal protein L11 methyltransferase, partial [Clostridiales Family XIII bacterium]|nr:50S ribosomal protein L11 methyltransferase [Clostridiales Family XIII bacterium]
SLALNDAEAGVALVCGDVTREDVRRGLLSETAGQGYNLILANLTSGIIRIVLPALPALAAPGCRCVFSGILAEEQAGMEAALAAAGLSGIGCVQKGEWLALCADFS